MVEHLKSLPQAVPSSICRSVSIMFDPPKTLEEHFISGLFRAAFTHALQSLNKKTPSQGSFLSGYTYVVAREVVDGSLCQHAVVFKLALSQWWCVSGNDDELGLSRSQSLQC